MLKWRIKEKSKKVCLTLGLSHPERCKTESCLNHWRASSTLAASGCERIYKQIEASSFVKYLWWKRPEVNDFSPIRTSRAEWRSGILQEIKGRTTKGRIHSCSESFLPSRGKINAAVDKTLNFSSWRWSAVSQGKSNDEVVKRYQRGFVI